jgi:hypothetical protein
MVIRNHTTKISKNISKVVEFDHFKNPLAYLHLPQEKHGRVVFISRLLLSRMLL